MGKRIGIKKVYLDGYDKKSFKFMSLDGKKCFCLNAKFSNIDNLENFHTFKQIDCTEEMETMFWASDWEIKQLLYYIIESKLENEKNISNN